jgi:hypothetical protein
MSPERFDTIAADSTGDRGRVWLLLVEQQAAQPVAQCGERRALGRAAPHLSG